MPIAADHKKGKNMENAKRILIVGDTHGRNDDLKKLLKRMETPDLLIHTGDMECDPEKIEKMADCEVAWVTGNCDFGANFVRDRELTIGKHKILLTHGHKYSVSVMYDILIEEAQKRGADIAIFGHTHKPLIQQDAGLYLINPGSLTYPRQDSRKPTFIMMEIDDRGEVHFTLNEL